MNSLRLILIGIVSICLIGVIGVIGWRYFIADTQTELAEVVKEDKVDATALSATETPTVVEQTVVSETPSPASNQYVEPTVTTDEGDSTTQIIVTDTNNAMSINVLTSTQISSTQITSSAVTSTTKTEVERRIPPHLINAPTPATHVLTETEVTTIAVGIANLDQPGRQEDPTLEPEVTPTPFPKGIAILPTFTPQPTPIEAAEATGAKVAEASQRIETGEMEEIREAVVSLAQGDAIGSVGISQAIDELLPRGPQALVVDEQGIFYILDSLNQRILRFRGKDQDEIVTINLAQPSFPQDMVVQAGQFYLLDLLSQAVIQVDEAGETIETYPLPTTAEQAVSGIAVSASGDVSVQIENMFEYPLLSQNFLEQTEIMAQVAVRTAGISVAGQGQDDIRAQFLRLNDYQAELRIRSRLGKISQTLLAETEQFLGGMQLQAVDEAGNFYVLVDELLMDVPAFVVDTTLRRYNVDGQLTHIAPLPTENAYFIPQQPIAVSQAGEAYFLHIADPRERAAIAAQVLPLNFKPTANYESDLSARWLDLQANPPQPLTDDALPLNVLTELAAAEVDAQALKPSVTRSEAIEQAKAYVYFKWPMQARNYGLGSLECDEGDWALPGYLQNRLGQTISEVPYQWGGYSSFAQIERGLREGRLAGDACVCLDPARQYCINYNEAVGVDCSGFISRVWGTQRYTTRGLPQITAEIPWSALQPGDILNWAGSHVLMFDKFGNGGVHGYESTSDCNWRVCYNFRSYSSLNERFIPRRYHNITEPAPEPTPEPYSLEITVSRLRLLPDGRTLVSASIVDEDGDIIIEKTLMTFMTNLGTLTPQIMETDANGIATVAFSSTAKAGIATITVTGGDYIGTAIIDIQALNNRTPYAPSSPSPVDGAAAIPFSEPQFTWSGDDADGDDLTYTWSLRLTNLGTLSPPPLVITTTKPSLRLPNFKGTPPLRPAGNYLWQVTATDGISTTIGPVWHFTTAEE